MAGNSERRGAKRNPGSKKGPTVGSGGQRRKQLKGKGPTPKATDRPSHPAHRKAPVGRQARRVAGRPVRPAPGRPARSRARDTGTGPEWVAGRNPVVEALRAEVPATALYVAERIDTDDRVRESLKLAGQLGIPLLEAPPDRARPDHRRRTHQGLALQVPAVRVRAPRRPARRGPTRPARRRCWSRSTASPTRATSARSSGRPRPSARTASSCRSGGRPA